MVKRIYSYILREQIHNNNNSFGSISIKSAKSSSKKAAFDAFCHDLTLNYGGKNLSRAQLQEIFHSTPVLNEKITFEKLISDLNEIGFLLCSQDGLFRVSKIAPS